jgi:uncharacterized protein
MQISQGIEMRNGALYMSGESILIINDLHIGYEESLHREGILVPRVQIEKIIKKLQLILKSVSPKTIVINGDLKHAFGKILEREWKEILHLFDFLAKHTHKVIVIQGNHDPIIKPITEKRGIEIKKKYRVHETLIIHGDKEVKTDAKRIIIGHEHPAITVREGSKWEKYKCYLKGKWKHHELLVMPSFNPLLEGTDVLKEQLLSPFLSNSKNFEVFVLSKGEVFPFGSINNI